MPFFYLYFIKVDQTWDQGNIHILFEVVTCLVMYMRDFLRILIQGLLTYIYVSPSIDLLKCFDNK